ncbi:metallophosphoesterase family protein [Pseudodesulfovibrio cashew]|nr:metallophosphoesterase family protein [Pseudodesulfovibrio cashew]
MTHPFLAVLADIHGNSLALRAVLDDAARRGADRLVNLGDTFYGPLDPGGTWDLLKDLDMPAILGNQDRVLLENGPEWASVPTFRATMDAIGEAGLDWLRSLSPTLVMDSVLLCHGTPANDTAYLLEDVSTGLPVPRNCEEIGKDLKAGAEGCSLVLAGHSHLQGETVCGGVTVVNPGSVGLPAYDDDTPPHAMASGSPHARYALIYREEQGWRTEFVAVRYDWEQAAAMAARNGREDWAGWLRTGLA